MQLFLMSITFINKNKLERQMQKQFFSDGTFDTDASDRSTTDTEVLRQEAT